MSMSLTQNIFLQIHRGARTHQQLSHLYRQCPPQLGFEPQPSRFPHPASPPPQWWRYSDLWQFRHGPCRLPLWQPMEWKPDKLLDRKWAMNLFLSPWDSGKWLIFLFHSRNSDGTCGKVPLPFTSCFSKPTTHIGFNTQFQMSPCKCRTSDGRNGNILNLNTGFRHSLTFYWAIRNGGDRFPTAEKRGSTFQHLFYHPGEHQNISHAILLHYIYYIMQ